VARRHPLTIITVNVIGIDVLVPFVLFLLLALHGPDSLVVDPCAVATRAADAATRAFCALEPPVGFEPTTYRLQGDRSNQLS
jgi:hypothetical protein